MRNINLKNISIEIKLIAVISFFSCLFLLLKVANSALYINILKQLALFSNFKVFNFRIWQFITYSFIHADLLHLVFNMFMLYLFSMLFFTFFNKKQFLKAFFLGGIAAGVFYFLIATVFNINTFVVGASGAIMAVFFTVVGYNPKMRVHLIIFGNIAIFYIAIAFLVFDVLQLFFANAGGHLAHIGGSLFGFCYGKFLGGFIHFPSKVKSQSKLKTVHKKQQLSKFSNETDIQSQVDTILDKISKSGYESLTAAEKEFLFKQK